MRRCIRLMTLAISRLIVLKRESAPKITSKINFGQISDLCSVPIWPGMSLSGKICDIAK